MFNKKLKADIEWLYEAQNGLLRRVRSLDKEITLNKAETARIRKVLLIMLKK